MTSYFVQVIVLFEISKFFISEPIWPKFGSGDEFWALIPNLKWYFTLEANIKPMMAMFCKYASKKATDIP